jgi:hypothetical protein
MIRILTCQICILGSVVRALRVSSERLPVLIQTVCFCFIGKGAPILFKSLEPVYASLVRVFITPNASSPQVHLCLGIVC